MRVARFGLLVGVIAGAFLLGTPTTALAQGGPAFTTAPPEFSNRTTAGFAFEADGPAICQLDSGQASECSSPVSVPDLKDGPHSFTVTTPSGSATHEWTVDTVKPSLRLSTSVKGWTGGNTPVTSDRTASFSFSTSDPTADITCRIDAPITYLQLNMTDGSSAGKIPMGSGAYVPCSSPQALSDLPEGLHISDFRVMDRAGNGSTGSVRWKVDYNYVPPDTTPPQLMFDPVVRIDRDTYEIPFRVSEEASITCRIQGGGVKETRLSSSGTRYTVDTGYTTDFVIRPCSSPIRWTGAPEGRASVSIEAVDPSGNKANVGRNWGIDQTPPEVIITQGPDAVSGPDQVFRFSSSESDQGQAFECSLDDRPWMPCASPVELKGLPDGRHAFSIRATDPAGNTGGARTVEWLVDGIAPEARIASGPDRLTSSPRAAFAIEVSDSSAYLECSLDGAAWGPCKAVTDLTELAEGAHQFSVRAVDAVGNAGPVDSMSWTIDMTGPVVDVTSAPPPGPTLGTTARFAWLAEAGATFTCRVDARPWIACSSPTTFSGIGAGDHTFEVKAVDYLGNEGPVATRSWATTDPPVTDPPVTVPLPTVSITSGPPEKTASTVAEFRIDHTPGTTLSCRSTLLPLPFQIAWKPCASPVRLTGFQSGNHRFEVRATDPEGRVSVARLWVWQVDTIAPRINFTAKPLSTTSTTLADFSFASDDRNATFTCSLDGGPWAPCPGSASFRDLAVGTHTFEVVATDPLGNRSNSVPYTWEVIPPDPNYSVFGDLGDPPPSDPTPTPGPDPTLEPEPTPAEDPEPTATPTAEPVQSGPKSGPALRILSAPKKTASRRPLFRVSAPAPGTENLCAIGREAPVRCGSAWRPAGRLVTGAHLFQVRTRALDGTLSAPLIHRFRVLGRP